ncbi:MAG: tetratricopeptide repeat protein [Candidatus Obscuribacterales bacterium]|nr:tetratricopeptide repeat protein [Candidatus Obscuribacterales bacterium]
MSIAKNSAAALVSVGVFAYLIYVVVAALFSGIIFTPLMLTYVCVTAFVAYRLWSNFLYAILLPYTEWKMYKRDYVRLNRVYRKVLAIAKPIGLNDYAEVVARCNLGLVQLQLGELEEAEDIYRQCLELLSKLPPNPRFKGVKQVYGVYVSCGLAVALCHREKFLEAELLLANVFDAINDKKTAVGMYEGYAYYLLGHVHLGLKEATAEANILKGMKQIQNAKPSASVREHSRSQMLNACNLALARIYIEGGRVEEANSYHEKFFADLEQGKSTVSPLAVKDLHLLASQFLLVHDYVRAEKILQLCYFLMSPTPFAPLAKQTLSMYETLLTETGRVGEISDLKSWLHPISLLTSVS